MCFEIKEIVEATGNKGMDKKGIHWFEVDALTIYLYSFKLK